MSQDWGRLYSDISCIYIARVLITIPFTIAVYHNFLFSLLYLWMLGNVFVCVGVAYNLIASQSFPCSLAGAQCKKSQCKLNVGLCLRLHKAEAFPPRDISLDQSLFPQASIIAW